MPVVTQDLEATVCWLAERGLFSLELRYVLAESNGGNVESIAADAKRRVLLAELTRINSHLVFVGTAGFDLGASSVFLYCLREREKLRAQLRGDAA